MPAAQHPIAFQRAQYPAASLLLMMVWCWCWPVLVCYLVPAKKGEDGGALDDVSPPQMSLRVAVGSCVLVVCGWGMALLQPPRFDILLGLAAFGELWRALLTVICWSVLGGSGLSPLQAMELGIFGACVGLSAYVENFVTLRESGGDDVADGDEAHAQPAAARPSPPLSRPSPPQPSPPPPQAPRPR